LEAIFESCINTVHWVFAMKYWSVSRRLELIKAGKNPNQLNSMHRTFYIAGILFNVVGGLMYGIPIINDWIIILVQVMQLGIIVSCILLADAFRRLK